VLQELGAVFGELRASANKVKENIWAENERSYGMLNIIL
jgi:hypothetical protein